MSSFVTIVLKEAKKKTPKKAMLPPAISQLKKQAERLFKIKPPKKIQTIYDSDGNTISSISEIVPGMEIVVSTNLPEEDFESTNQENIVSSPMANFDEPLPQSTSPTQIVVPKKVNPPPLSAKPTISSGPSAVKGQTPPRQSPQLQFSNSGRQTAGLEQSPTSKPISGRQTANADLQPSPLSHSPSRRNEPEQNQPLVKNSSGLAIITQADKNDINQDPSPRAGSPPRSPRKQQSKQEGTEDEVAPEFLTEEEKERRRLLAKGIDRQKIAQIFEQSLGTVSDIASSQAIKAALDATPVIIQRFMTQSLESQQQQQTVLNDNINDVIFRYVLKDGKVPPHTAALDSTIAKIVDDGSFATQGGTQLNFRIAVVGPRQSGKSVFASLLARQIYTRLLATNQSKHTAIFTLDFETFGKALEDPIEFYRTMVDLSLDQIASQRIELSKHIQSLKAYFQRLPTLEKLTPLPPKFALTDDFRAPAAVLTEMSQNVYNALKTSSSLQVFMTNVVMIPKFVAKAFGYRRVLFVADHVDLTDIETPCNDELDDNVSNLPLIEFIKLMLSDSPFIISCKEESHLLEALELIAEDSTDLRNGTDIISVVDSDPSKDHSNDMTFELTVQGMKEKLLIRRDDLGGCPGYLNRWDTLVQMGDVMLTEEHKEKGSRRSKEAKLSLIAKVRELAAYLFADEDDSGAIIPFKGKITDFNVIKAGTDEDKK